ncbi:uncharacterized protein LOC122537313 [Frieseomelitta varia]|uniref:uncharacterized protein LOC122537313 n=1 Tax=Frieseomelitta varia TaxID=561572 RepID=UPI001CB6999E|nr:uncharacterized protein LOC122537313 [Frieseomelitta varia]
MREGTQHAGGWNRVAWHARACTRAAVPVFARTGRSVWVLQPRGQPQRADLQPPYQLDIYFNEVRRMSRSCPGEQICRDIEGGFRITAEGEGTKGDNDQRHKEQIAFYDFPRRRRSLLTSKAICQRTITESAWKEGRSTVFGCPD